jgi:hypothetical protein
LAEAAFEAEDGVLGAVRAGLVSPRARVAPIIINFDETFDMRVDTRSGVDDKDYQVPFRFNGTIDSGPCS